MSQTHELVPSIPAPLPGRAILSRMPSLEPDRDLETEVALGDLFLLTSRQVRHRWAASLTPWDLAPHQGRALRLVADLGPVRPGVLAEHLRIAPRSVTDVVDALEQRGFVERHPDPGDRRATVLHLTSTGREVRAAIDASRREEADDFFGRLCERDQATLRHILLQLTTEDAASRETRGGHPDDGAVHAKGGATRGDLITDDLSKDDLTKDKRR